MKISKDRLTQIIEEELSISLGSVGNVGPGMIGGEAPHVESDGEGYMAKQNLWKISEYAGKLYNMMGDTDNLEPWVEEKIAVAAFIMDSVGHYIEYAKHREAEASGGCDECGENAEMEPAIEMEPAEDYEDDEEYEFEPDEKFGGEEGYEEEEPEESDEEEYEDEEEEGR